MEEKRGRKRKRQVEFEEKQDVATAATSFYRREESLVDGQLKGPKAGGGTKEPPWARRGGGGFMDLY